MKLGVVESVLATVVVLFLLSDTPMPRALDMVPHTVGGQFLLAAILLAACWFSHPILSTLAILLVFEWIRRSWMNAESVKSSHMHALDAPHRRQLEDTLEEEMVRTMAPAVYSGTPLTPASYAPSQTNVDQAASVQAPYKLST